MNLLIALPSLTHTIVVGIVIVLGILALHIWANEQSQDDDIDDPTQTMYL